MRRAFQLFFWGKNAGIFQAQFLRNFSIHSFEINVVQVGMNGVNSHVVFNGLDDDPLDVVAAGEFFQPPENDGMVGDDEVAAFLNRLVNDLLRRIQAADGTFNFSRSVAGNQACVVVIFLVSGGSQGFEMGDNVLDCEHFPNDFGSGKDKSQRVVSTKFCRNLAFCLPL